MSDPDEPQTPDSDVTQMISDEGSKVSDNLIDLSGDNISKDSRTPSPTITTSQRYQNRQATKNDRLKTVAAFKASGNSKIIKPNIVKQVRNKSSAVWKVFDYVRGEDGVLNYNSVECRLCGKVLTHNSNTTSMRNHINSKHPYAICAATDSNASVMSQPRPGPSGDTAARQRNTMDAYIHNKSKYPRNHTLSKKWDKLAAMYIIKDLRPLDSLEGDGLRAWVEAMVPSYSLPSRNYILYNVMWPMYHGTKENVKSILHNSESIALTTDGWSSNAHESYISLTAHIIDSEFKLKSFLLSTEHMTATHTGVNLLSHMNKLLKEWGIENKKLFWITDNASNIKNAVKLGGYDWVGCMGHTVNLAIKKALELPDVNRIIGSAKSIVTFIRQSNNACQQMKESAKDQGFPTLQLIQDVETRWNSAKYMLERLLEMYPVVAAVLVNNDKVHLVPADNTKSNMKLICDFLSDFDSATQIISGEKYATISLLKPLLKTLSDHCMVNDTDDCNFIKNVKQTVKKDLDQRYKEQSTQTILNITTILDPRLKNDNEYGSQDNQNELISITEALWESSDFDSQIDSDIIPDTQSQQGATYSRFGTSHCIPLNKKQKKAEEFKSKLFKINSSNVRNDTLHVRVGREVDRYMTEPQEGPDTDPLEWWKFRQNSYPLLTKTFRNYFNIPATSVPSERAFSLCSNVITKKRARLLSENVNIITFLYSNLDYIPDITPTLNIF